MCLQIKVLKLRKNYLGAEIIEDFQPFHCTDEESLKRLLDDYKLTTGKKVKISGYVIRELFVYAFL